MSVLQTLVTVSVLVALGYLAALAATTIAAALQVGGRREEAPDEHDPLAASRLTMPVSIVVPAAESPRVSQVIGNLADLTYSELEIIVIVEEGRTNLAPIEEDWQLEAREFFYRRALDTAPVRRIFRSLRDPRVVVVEKEPGSRSDALNCGFNFARYRFVAVVPPTVSFTHTALLSAMTPALRDPITIVGIGSPVERVPDPHTVDREARLQRLRSLRSLMATRLFWAGRRRGLGPSDGVIVWRRDAVLQANGFARDAADSDLDMMFRLQRTGADERRFVRNGDAFGHAATVPEEVARDAAARQQRSTLKTMASWGPAAGQSVGYFAFGSFLASSVATPLAQLWIVLATVGGAAAGWFSWFAPLAAVLLLSFGTATITAAALLLRGGNPEPPATREVQALLTLSPFEFVLYRPIETWSRIRAIFSRESDAF